GEVSVQLLECGDKPPATFLVERTDPLPETRDRLRQIAPLALQTFEAGFNLAHFALGNQIDRPDRLPVAQHAFEPRRQRTAVGHCGGVAIADNRVEIFRAPIQPLDDFLSQARQTFLRSIALRIEPGAALARLPRFLPGSAQA